MSFSDSDSPSMLQLWFAGPALQVEYDPLALQAEDRAREAARLASRNAHEWRVSRALQRRLLHPRCSSSLSHSDGHALWAASSAHERIGVDLERIRPIDELALAELVAHEDEMDLLRLLQGQDRIRFFYRLWTLKEALVKAMQGDFPADMLQTGLRRAALTVPVASHMHMSSDATLPTDVDRALRMLRQGDAGSPSELPLRLVGLGEGRWHGLSAMIGQDWMMAVVWPADGREVGKEGKEGKEASDGSVLAKASLRQDAPAPIRIEAWLATPGEAQPLALGQTVFFGTIPPLNP